MEEQTYPTYGHSLVAGQEQVSTENSIVDETIAERTKVYGDPRGSHENIALSWTGLIQQHYGLKLPHVMPPWLVAEMMVVFKMQRASRVYKEDNFIDAKAYGKFAEEWQRKDFEKQEGIKQEVMYTCVSCHKKIPASKTHVMAWYGKLPEHRCLDCHIIMLQGTSPVK